MLRILFPAFLLVTSANAFAGCARQPADFKGLMKSQLEFSRQSTHKLLDEMDKVGNSDWILAWRAAQGRAPIGWQLMHFASTEDRFAKALAGRDLVSEKYAEQFKSGQAPSDWIPKMPVLRSYLKESRSSLESAIDSFDLSRLDEKPSADSPFTYRRMFQILLWHEPHHHGQAHATFNLYKAANKIADTKPDM